MSNKILFGLSATAAILLSACGGDVVTEVTEVNETGMKVLDKGEKMPKCNADSEGDMIYALDSAGAFICIDKKWTSLNGKDGEPGEKGDKGDQGKKGEKGDQGEKGEDGASCTAKALADSSGYKIICGGDSVGVVLNGEQGEKGDKGDQGEQGPKGDKGDKGDPGIPKCPSYDASKQFCDARDGRVYKYVAIGTQTWMAENLNFVTDSSLCYDNDPANCETYGRLYAGKSSDPCPSGWRLPTEGEYDELEEFAGGASGGAGKKLTATSGWYSESGESRDGTDDYGFAVLAAGYYTAYDSIPFSDLGMSANFWTSTIDELGMQVYMHMWGEFNSFYAVHGHSETQNYKSIRCIKD